MKKYIFVLVILCIFIQGCSSSYDIDAYKKGFTGLSFSYNSNLKELYEGDMANINLLLKNEGSYDIENGIIKISIEEDYVEMAGESKKYFELTGGSKDFPEGESTTNIFSVRAKALDEKSIERESDFHITSCYDYGTDFSIDVCIDSDVYNSNPNKVCTPSEKSINQGQGGPVTINKIEARMIYDEENQKIIPSFTLNIANQGNGNVIKRNKIDEICSSEGVENEDFNIIEIRVELPDANQLVALECSQNPVKLREGEKQVICTYTPGLSLDVGTYYTPLHINLEYGYMEVVSGNFKIKKINT